MRTGGGTQSAIAGFTLVEVVIAVVILSTLLSLAMMKLVTPATMTLPVQAQSFADQIRRAQSLAVVRGQRISVSVIASGPNGRMNVACVASAPCNTDTDITASQGVVLGSASTIYFNSLGQPVNSAGAPLSSDTTYTLSYQTGTQTGIYTVTVGQLTGHVSVSP